MDHNALQSSDQQVKAAITISITWGITLITEDLLESAMDEDTLILSNFELFSLTD